MDNFPNRKDVVITIPDSLWRKWNLDDYDNYNFVLHAMYLGLGPEAITDLLSLPADDSVRTDYVRTAQFMGIREGDRLYRWI